DGTCQVVVNNRGKNAAEEIKGMDVGVKKGLLLLTWICPHKVLARKTGSHAEKVKRCLYIPDHRNTSAPVTFCPFTTVRIKDQKGCRKLGTQSRFHQPHITPDINLTAVESFLLDKAVVNPSCRVPLFLRTLPVLSQPPLYRFPVGFQNRVGLLSFFIPKLAVQNA
ncbi:MAG: hypothetical protein L7F78_13915, partial [Syntrophales bacterium LBB04]|nr:hypothetical protein [Syntrophales bacterium LBB04]